MRSIYATRFHIDDAAFDEVRDRLLDWARSGVRRQKVDLDFLPDGQPQQTPEGHRLRLHEQAVADGRALELEWQHPDRKKADLLWNTRLTLAQDGDDVEFGCLVRLGSKRFTVAPFGAISAGAPGLIREVLSEYRCRAAAVQIASGHTQVQAGQVPLLVPFLLSADRALPIVLVSQDNLTGEPLVAPADVQERLAGLAHVYEITAEAGFELTDELGRTSSCYNGAVRVYWPRFEPTEWKKHPLYLPERIRGLRERGASIEYELFRLLAGIASSRYDDGDVWQRLRAKANRARQEEIRQRLAAKADGEVDREEYEAFLADYEETLGEVDRLRDEIRQLRDENAAHRQNLDALAQYTPDSDDAGDGPGAVPDDEPSTVADALDRAAATFSDRLDVWASARDAAADSASDRATDVYDGLKAIAKLAAEYFEAPDRKTGPWADFFAQHGLKYAPGESEMTMNQYGAERLFRDGERERTIEKHLTIAKGTRKHCVQIYFDADDDTKRFTIGYCGNHLSTYRGTFNT